MKSVHSCIMFDIYIELTNSLDSNLSHCLWLFDKIEQIHKMTIIFTEKAWALKRLERKNVIILWICYVLSKGQTQWLVSQPDSGLKSESSEWVNFIEKLDQRRLLFFLLTCWTWFIAREWTRSYFAIKILI